MAFIHSDDAVHIVGYPRSVDLSIILPLVHTSQRLTGHSLVPSPNMRSIIANILRSSFLSVDGYQRLIEHSFTAVTCGGRGR